jgi:hypothetical protein
MSGKAAITPAKLDRRHLLVALRTFRKGDFSVRLPIGPTGIDGEITEAFNDVVPWWISSVRSLPR